MKKLGPAIFKSVSGQSEVTEQIGAWGRKIHGQWDSEEATKWKKASLALELFMV